MQIELSQAYDIMNNSIVSDNRNLKTLTPG